ncbi:MAG: hypothetical protein LBJ94_03860 [Puniceicoccales bacterium]|nr:hypothetical protein [Puniceicoccales bacterium]
MKPTSIPGEISPSKNFCHHCSGLQKYPMKSKEKGQSPQIKGIKKGEQAI